MKKTLLALFLLGSLLTGCSEDKMMEESPENIQFHLSRTDGILTGNQQTRLFVVQKAQEGQSASGTNLYCGLKDRYFLTNSSFLVKDLYLQWYKFAFVSVPDYPGILEGKNLFSDKKAAPDTEEKTTTDFTRLAVDVTACKHLLDTNPHAATQYDLNIYRGIVDRWTRRPDETKARLTENVKLKRINGQFNLNMGKLTDQFAYPVNTVKINFQKFPTRVFIYDNKTFEESTDNQGNIIEDDAQVIVDTKGAEDWTFTYTIGQEEQQGLKECLITLPALPHHLQGAFITVTVQKGNTTESYDYPLPPTVTIKPNMRTLLLFHGMYSGQFEVQYNDDAGITIGPENGNSDDWIGWE